MLAAALLLATLAACGTSDPVRSTRGDQPATEPGTAPPVTGTVPGRTFPVGAAAEGVVVSADGTAAVIVRKPDALALVDLDTGAVRQRVPLPSGGRHLSLLKPGGPFLVPLEGANELLLVDPRTGAITRTVTGLTKNPHDATAFPDGTIAVTDERGGGMYFLPPGATTATRLDGPRQPGGVADVGGFAMAIDVRGGGARTYDPTVPKQLDAAPLGEGLTHLVAIGDWQAAVADTAAGKVLIVRVTPDITDVRSLPAPGRPYGLAVDRKRGRLYVALSSKNQVLVYDTGKLFQGAKPLGVVQTVQNPYTVAADPRNGDLVIAGQATGVLQVVPHDQLPGS